MAFAILRVTKMNSMGSIGGKDSHELRQRETLNADPERAELNRQVIGTVAVDDVKERLGAAGVSIRKDSVLAIDVFATASPEFFKENHPDDIRCKIFQDSLIQFLEKEFGKDNLVSLRAHHDETSPHWHATIVPIREKTIKVGRQIKTERTENRLCAKDWLGGDRHTLSKLQTRFADGMKHLGLQRGIMGSQAKHVEVKQFYTLAKEAVNQSVSVQQHFPLINPDRYSERIKKPGVLDRFDPEEYAHKSVKTALSELSADIDKVNRSVSQAKQNELKKTAMPAINALTQKGEDRRSQAEKALSKLGYRLDQHGQIIDVLEERKNEIKGTISNVLVNSMSPESFQQELAKKGIKIGSSKDDQETIGNKTYKVFLYKDGKGDPISSRDLGPEFTVNGIFERISKNQEVEQERINLEKCQKVYDATIAGIFAYYKGSATEVSKYLKNLQPDQKEDIINRIGEEYGTKGTFYVQNRLQTDIDKNDVQLASDRDKLRREGYDIGKSFGNTLKR